MAPRLQPPAPALESRLPRTGRVRGKESTELSRHAHRLASRAGRRSATRADLGSKTRQFFSRPQRVKGGRKNWYEDETKASKQSAPGEIGRAPCRERGKISVVAES